MVKTAIVKIWEESVGAVAWDEDQELGYFEFEPSFLQNKWDLSPLKMSINSNQRVFSFPELRAERNAPYDTFKGLPGLLADSLPDKYGNQLIDVWLAQQGRQAGSMNPVEKLCFIGSRAMGALEFEPQRTSSRLPAFKVELDSLVDIAGQMMQERESFVANLNQEKETAIREIITIGTSAGGARPKAVIALNKKTGEVRSGQTIAPKGFEHWLIKLDGVSEVQLGDTHGYGRVEMAYYLMAKDAGIQMAPCDLIEENGRAHFITKRFDRDTGSTRHHVQTFCAMNHFDFNDVHSFSYEQLFRTMRELRLDYSQAEQMFRRMVFNVIGRNCDDHTKNFSFLLKKNQKWTLSPAYDICHAYSPNSKWVSQHALSINGKRKNIQLEDFLAIAKLINIKNPKDVINDVNESVSKWTTFADEVGVDNKKRDTIRDSLLDITA